LITLSEQELVDCDKTDSGCQGGLMDNAFAFLKQNGVDTDADYKYTGRDGACQAKKFTPKVKVTGFKDISTNEDEIARVLVENGPLSVAVDASSFQFYAGGIAQCSYRQLNHGVTLVGYGEDNGRKFWIVKNSWGTGWGEQGYIRIPRGKGACGINMMVSTSVVAKL